MNNYETPPLEVFIDSGFDLEKMSLSWQVVTRHNRDGFANNHDLVNTLFDSKSGKLRPRLNKPQVLGGYSFIEPLEGFVWGAEIEDEKGFCIELNPCETDVLLNSESPPFEIERFIWLSFQGVEQGSRFEQWAIANDVPILNNNGEVVE